MSSYRCNGRYANDDWSLIHFERPDFVNVSILADLAVGQQVGEGQAIGLKSSLEDQYRIAAVRGLLQQAQANYALLDTGAKEPLQQEARESLEYARAELEAYKPILTRQKELYEKQLISEQELEITEAQYQLYKINVSLQEARLKGTRTGEKDEALAVADANLKTLSQQLDLLEQKAVSDTIVSPIQGIIVPPDRKVGELFHVCNMDSMILQMPVAQTTINRIREKMSISINVPGMRDSTISAKINYISPIATMVNTSPMFMVTATLPNPQSLLYHGMTGTMSIRIGRLSLLERLLLMGKRY